MHLESTQRWRARSVRLFLLTPALVSEAYVGWLNDPAVNRYLESRFQVHDIGSTRAFVERMLQDPTVLFLGIHSLVHDRHVGNIKLGPIDRNHGLGEVGIMIGDRSAWGQGLASEAIERLADIASSELGLRKLSAGCYASNRGSERAFVKAGFRVEARRPSHFLLDGRPQDSVLMGRLLEPTSRCDNE